VGAQSAPRLYQCGRAWRGAYLHCICYTFKAPRSGPMAPRARRSIPVEHWSTVCTRLPHPTSVQLSAPGAPINSWSPGAQSTVSCRQRPTLPSLRRSGWRHNSRSASGRRGHCWMTLRCLTAAGDTRLDSFDASHFPGRRTTLQPQLPARRSSSTANVPVCSPARGDFRAVEHVLVTACRS